MASRGILTPIERAELAAQSDMQERGKRLAKFKAETEGRQWVCDANTGEWTLERIYDGSCAIALDLIAA